MELSPDLLGKLYAATHSEDHWTPLLDELRTRLGASSAVLQMLDETPDRLDPIWQARDSRSIANSRLHDTGLNNPGNPRLHKPAIAHLPPELAADLMRVGSDRRLFGHSPRVLSEIQQRLARVGLGHAFWVSAPLAGARRFSLILHREAGDDRDPSEGEEAVLRALLPHMQQAAKLWLSREEAASRTHVLEHALDRLDLALVVLDAELRVHWSNAAAAELIARGQGLRIVDGRLYAAEPASDETLRRAVRTVCSGAADSQVCVIGGNDEPPIHLRATRSPGSLFPVEPSRVVLFLSQPGLRDSLDPDDLGALFELTPAEARLAAALARGASLASYSEERGISIGTARNQLKQVLAKTATRGQVDLVRTLCSSAASRVR